jgi:hypothetical protein
MESDLLQGDSGDDACPKHVVFPVKTAPLLSAWVGFFCFAMFVYSPYFSGHNLCIAQILLEYLLVCS